MIYGYIYTILGIAGMVTMCYFVYKVFFYSDRSKYGYPRLP